MMIKPHPTAKLSSMHQKIIIISNVILILALFFIVNVKTALASEVQVTFTGVVSEIIGTGAPGVNLDDPVSGTVIYDSTIMDTHPSSNIGNFLEAITSYNATIGSVTYSLAPFSPWTRAIVVLDDLEDSTGYTDMIEFEDTVLSSADVSYHYLEIVFSTRTTIPSSWIESSSVLPTDLDLDAAGRKYGRISQDPSSSSHYVRIEISNATMKLVPIFITIDIDPRNRPENIINLNKGKKIRIALLGSTALDILQVNSETVEFGPGLANPIRFREQDYNHDGFSDLILTFMLEETGIGCGDTEATLTGETHDGVAIEGSDNFTVEPCP